MSAPCDALSGIQLLFAATLHDTEQVPALIDRLRPAVAKRADGGLLVDRIGLYRGNLHAHRHGALANAYPVLLSLVGDTYFDGLCRAYGAAHPSTSGDLNWFGDALAEFLAMYEGDPRFSYFADIARLEWALHQAHYVADVVPFSAQDWAAMGDALLDARMAVHPACRAIASSHAIADIWLAHQPGGAFPEVIDTPSHVLVVRPAWKATLLVQSEAAHEAFLALQRGETLNTALDIAFAIDEGFDFATQWRAWIDAVVVTGVVGDKA